MKRFQPLIGSLLFELILIQLCQGFPIPLTSQESDSSIDLSSSLIAVIFLVATISLVFGCVCCRRNKGFEPSLDTGSPIVQEFNNIPSNTNIAFENPTIAHIQQFVDPGGGEENNLSNETNEVTLFPPTNLTSPSKSDHSNIVVKFEPLPEIISSNSTEKSTPVPVTLLRRPTTTEIVPCSDWFENPAKNFPRQQLHYLRELGRGWFGRAVEGEATGLNEESCNIAPRRVVVKILHEDATPEDQQAFLHEVRPYRDLKHHNVLRLLGRCLDQEPFLVVLESCSSGDLKSFLRQHESSAVALMEQGVTLRMACHVAAGLKHMHDHGFVHTDLAARNCLVGADLTVKIGDYGTSFEAFKNEYYWSGDLAVPVRWCSPESLYYTDTTIEPRTVTPAANIWSLGVILWEICQMGQLPYSSLSDDEVVVSVLGPARLRLPIPNLVPDYPQKYYLYRIMQACWRIPDIERPEIQHIWTILEHLHSIRHSSSNEQETIFEERWASLKPNKQEQKGTINENLSHCSSPQSSFISVDRSASLQNLHGSVEDLINETCQSTVVSSVMDSRETSLSLTYESLGDEKVTEAIRQIDDALASERTSSSDPTSLSPTLIQKSCTLQKMNVRTTIDDSDEDDTWRRIQQGEFTEKVKQKSKSVADLMILTHIDTSDASDSEPPSIGWPERLDSLGFLDLSMPSFSLIKSEVGSFKIKPPLSKPIFNDNLFSTSFTTQEDDVSLEQYQTINYNNIIFNNENELLSFNNNKTEIQNKNVFPSESSDNENKIDKSIIINASLVNDNFYNTISPNSLENEKFAENNFLKKEIFQKIPFTSVEEEPIAQLNDIMENIESKIFHLNSQEKILPQKSEFPIENIDNFKLNKIINKNVELQFQEVPKENSENKELNNDILNDNLIKSNSLHNNTCLPSTIISKETSKGSFNLDKTKKSELKVEEECELENDNIKRKSILEISLSNTREENKSNSLDTFSLSLDKISNTISSNNDIDNKIETLNDLQLSLDENDDSNKHITREMVLPIAEEFITNLISSATLYQKNAQNFSISPDPKELAAKLQFAKINNENPISLSVPSLHFTLATPQTSGRSTPDFLPPLILTEANVDQSEEFNSEDDDDIISDSITSVTPADELLSPSELASRMASSSCDPQPAPMLSTPSLSQDSDSYLPDDSDEFDKHLSSPELSRKECLKEHESSDLLKFLFAERILASILQEAQKELANFSTNIESQQSIFSLEEREQRPAIKLPNSHNMTSINNDLSPLYIDDHSKAKDTLSSMNLSENIPKLNDIGNSDLEIKSLSSIYNSPHIIESESGTHAPSPDKGFFMDDTEKSETHLDIQLKNDSLVKLQSVRHLSPLDSFGSKMLSPSTSQESDSIFSSEDNEILKENLSLSSNKPSSDEDVIKVVLETLREDEDPVHISTPDDERSSDSGFRDKGSLSESCDADSDAEDVSKPSVTPEGNHGLIKLFTDTNEDLLNAGDKSSETPASSSLESSVVTEIQPVTSIPTSVASLLPQVEDETPDVSSATPDHSNAETVNLEDRSIILENRISGVFSPEVLNFELQRPALSPEEQINNELPVTDFYNPLCKHDKEIKGSSEIFDILDKDATCEISFESEDENEELELEIDRYLEEDEPQIPTHLNTTKDREVELRNLEAHLRKCLEEDRSPTSTLEGMFEAAGAGTAAGGWYLHPPNVEEDTSTSSNSENSYVSFSLDEEFVQAIRNELNLKLPCATGGNNQHISLQPQRSSDDETPIDDEISDLEDRADLLIQYNVFPGALSPILEERESLSSISDLITKSSESEPPSPVSGDLLVVDTTTNTATLVSENSQQSPSTTIPTPPPLPTLTYTPDSLSPTMQSPSGEEYLTPEHAGSSGPAAIVSSGGSSEMYSCQTSPTSPENVPSEADESPDTEIPIRPITLLENDDIKIDEKDSEKETLEQISSAEENENAFITNDGLEEKTQEILTILDKATEGVRLSKHPDRLELVYSLSHGPDLLIDNEPPVSSECSTNWSLSRNNKAPMPSPEDESRKLLSDIRLITSSNSSNNTNQIEEDEMSTSFSHRDEYIQEWDSESHSSADGESSSSGEFIWKEGDHEESVKALKPTALGDDENEIVVPEEDDDDDPSGYDVFPEFPMASIAEEDEDDCGEDESDSEGSAEFVPSAWNSEATPNRSALRSPDKKSETKKNVSFKRQRYHCVYEYPREATTDSEEDIPDEWPSSDIIFETYIDPPVPEMSCNTKRYQHESIIAAGLDIKSFADWEFAEGDIGEGDADTDTDGDLSEGNSATQTEPVDFYRLSDFTEGLDDSEFFISSSSKPFAFGIHTSEFFPGRQGATSPECLEAIFGDSEFPILQIHDNNTTTNLGELRHTRDKLKLNLGSPAIENITIPTISNTTTITTTTTKTTTTTTTTTPNISISNTTTSLLNLELSNNNLDSKSKEKGEASLLDSGEETEDSGIESSNGRINGGETVAAELTLVKQNI